MTPTLLLAAAVLAAPGDGARIRSEVLPVGDGGFEVGRPLRWVVQIEHAAGAVPVLPEPLGLPDTVVQTDRTHRRLDDRTRDVYEIELVPFAAGTIDLPDLKLRLGDGFVSVEGPRFIVASSLDLGTQTATAVAQERLEALAAPDPEPEAIQVWSWPRILGLAGVLILLTALVAWLGRRRSAPARRTLDDLPPGPEALAALDALEPRLVDLTPAQSTAELTGIVRRFLERKYGVSGAATADELESELRARRLELDPELPRWLRATDYVKFARSPVTVEEVRDQLGRIRAFVESAPPRPEPAPPAPAAPAPAPAAFVEPSGDVPASGLDDSEASR